MIGSGEKLDESIALSKNLGVEGYVSFFGNMPNDEVLKQMRSHQIFLFTSEQNEGWGAVLNEAMSNGCAVVASDMIGSVPFLINDEINGLIYKSNSLSDLHDKMKRLLDDQSCLNQMARNAVDTMKNDWSPQVAAERLVALVQSLLDNSGTQFKEGPCSKALPTQ